MPRATERLQIDKGTFGLILLGMGVGAVIAMIFSGHLIALLGGAAALIRVSLAASWRVILGCSPRRRCRCSPPQSCCSEPRAD